jgi:ATP-binding cassette, subfamily B, bacterial
VSPRAPATAHELAQIPLLAELPGQRLAQLAKRMRREEVASGQAPIVEGDEGDRFYVVLNGVFAVSKQGGLGPRAVLRPGDYFGEVALAMHIPRTATVRALTPATVGSCDQATFDEFIRPFFADEDPGEDQQFRRVR